MAISLRYDACPWDIKGILQRYTTRNIVHLLAFIDYLSCCVIYCFRFEAVTDIAKKIAVDYTVGCIPERTLNVSFCFLPTALISYFSHIY